MEEAIIQGKLTDLSQDTDQHYHIILYQVHLANHVWYNLKIDDDIHFVLDQHAWLDFYNASSLRQQSASGNVVSFWHIILILCQPVFALTP